MPSDSSADDRRNPTIFQATITASREVFASLDHLDVDYMPTREQLRDGTWRVSAVVELNQLRPLVEAGAIVELERLIQPRLPRDRIMSSDVARKHLRDLERRLRGDT